VGSQSRVPAALTPGKTRCPLYTRLGGPQPVWTGAENLAPPRIRSPDRPARSESLYHMKKKNRSRTNFRNVEYVKHTSELSQWSMFNVLLVQPFTEISFRRFWVNGNKGQRWCDGACLSDTSRALQFGSGSRIGPENSWRLRRYWGNSLNRYGSFMQRNQRSHITCSDTSSLHDSASLFSDMGRSTGWIPTNAIPRAGQSWRKQLSQLVNKLPTFYGTRSFITVSTISWR